MCTFAKYLNYDTGALKNFIRCRFNSWVQDGKESWKKCHNKKVLVGKYEQKQFFSYKTDKKVFFPDTDEQKSGFSQKNNQKQSSFLNLSTIIGQNIYPSVVLFAGNIFVLDY